MNNFGYLITGLVCGIGITYFLMDRIWTRRMREAGEGADVIFQEVVKMNRVLIEHMSLMAPTAEMLKEWLQATPTLANGEYDRINEPQAWKASQIMQEFEAGYRALRMRTQEFGKDDQ